MTKVSRAAMPRLSRGGDGGVDRRARFYLLPTNRTLAFASRPPAWGSDMPELLGWRLTPGLHKMPHRCEPEPPQAMHRLYARHAWLC